ncbi:PorP/SprF family type IX secretion system membrane protein [Rufibacter sediminis]|uniref:PorP/SprF family type IX secretion system membrane protein n=1 Tax=Rufibacter sediminis TaxID=2762756 RepID=A0ABR6VW40_9BACT|nr:PorP/SprF family type IX secretion system membrane protein [Rufibacter sediminis]MBC3541363.1 PorP/SprF family type IX secretion system membrane protein [Rufibacter sediminis]
MNLKQLLAFSLLLLAASVSKAQVTPQRMVIPRLYQQNYFYLNPAFAGAERRKELGVNGHLNSLNGRGSSAPLSVIAHYQGYVSNENPNGIGMVAVYDQFGPYWLGKLGFSYTKRFRLGEQSSLAFGAQLAAEYLNVDLAEMTRTEERKMVGHDNDLRPDVDAGVWLNVRNFYAGATFASLLEPTFNLVEDAEHEGIRELLVTAGYKVAFAPEFSLTPSFLMSQPLKDGKQEYQFGTMANIKFLTAGVNYRGQFDKTAPWNVSAGVNIKDNVQLMTTFDITKEANGVAKPDPQVEANLRVRF